VDGVPVTQTTATLIRVPATVIDGPHTWQVTAVNRAGETSTTRTEKFFVDTLAPQASFTLTGRLRAGSYLHIYVRYTDAPPPEPGPPPPPGGAGAGGGGGGGHRTESQPP